MFNTITMDDQRVISSDVKFYTISDIAEMTGWSEKTVQKLFLDPQFPSADYGRIKVVESHALIDFFSSRHDRAKEKHWRG